MQLRWSDYAKKEKTPDSSGESAYGAMQMHTHTHTGNEEMPFRLMEVNVCNLFFKK